MEKLFTTSHINIFLHAGSHKTIEIQWLDFVPSADLRTCLLEMLRLARQHQVKAWLADNRLIRAMRPVDLEWVGQAIMLPMSELGVRRLAVVESQDAINRMGVNAMLAAVLPNTQLTTSYFATLTEARTWATAPF
ncbi:MAG: hypothetical protein EOO62_25975 [Hymenobacter sp.]|nr:MAG: hypothetical protein EOO62_25975 [Hymenobacter sp.]